MKHLYITLFFIVSFFTAGFAQTEFITTWQTTSANETITIPTTGSGYNYSVNWGDGTIENGLTGNATHEYAVADTYTVEITGDFPRFYSPGMGGYFSNAAKIQSIEQWGTQQWASMENAFDSTTNLVINATDVPDLSIVTSMQGMFFLNSSLVDNGGAMGTWDVSNVQDMGYLFRNTPFNEDISSWNTQNVTNMSNMLANCPNFDQNLGNWDISNVTNMSDMLVTSGLSLANYDATLIGWGLDSSGNAADGIDDVPSNINFNGGSSTYCVGIDARSVLTSAPYNWSITDSGTTCASTDFFITTWQTTSNAESITIPTTSSGYNYDIDWGDGNIEFGSTGNATHEYATQGTYRVRIIGNFPRIYFNGSSIDKDKIIAIDQWGIQQWTSMERAFLGCGNLEVKAADSPDLSNVTSLRFMFASCHSLDKDFSVDFSGWDTSGIEDFTFAFSDAIAFNSSSIANWDVSGATRFDFMFLSATSFDQDLSQWDVSSATSMDTMLRDTALSTENYDVTLIGWATLDSGETQIPSDIILDVDATYCLGEAARNTLTNAPYNWSITDEGLGCTSTDFFITTWQTTSTNESITIPTFGIGYDYSIDWGDGIIETGLTGNTLHEYATAGTYTVRIIGDFPRFYNPGLGGYISNAAKIQSIEQWGSQQWTSMEGAFDSATNMVINATDVPDLSVVTSMQGMFFLNSSIVDNGGAIGTWDVSNVQDMGFLFRNTPFNEDISTWNTQNVTNMSNMLANCPNFDQNL
ncbi:BspA family leucine-rich repeat surface protein, partial [Aquimarina litoralis]|uniref:BspA family leucine-rich repeat surface protein n=1 Tax=Aquimarina litoralis TaxID=584605 RepID=UPI001C57A206